MAISKGKSIEIPGGGPGAGLHAAEAQTECSDLTEPPAGFVAQSVSPGILAPSSCRWNDHHLYESGSDFTTFL